MITPQDFCDALFKHQLSFFCGVPDSLLKSLCAYIDDTLSKDQHIITANEGNAVALAIGHYLGSGKPAVVYMQNSGLGNAVNPLVSLADELVYGIPMMLVIGWRGEPGVKDEPQHVKQGQITEQLLVDMGIPYVIIDGQDKDVEAIQSLANTMLQASKPVAVLVRKNTFSTYCQQSSGSGSGLSRERALEVLLSLLSEQDLVVATTGKTSRELFELRKAAGMENNDFLTVGGMGHATSIAMGVALTQPDRRVVALDGDGALLMHMGALPVIANHGVSNMLHIVLNNGCHESVGGQQTVAEQLDMRAIALGGGYKSYFAVESEHGLCRLWHEVSMEPGPTFVEIKIIAGSRGNLGRPTCTPKQNKVSFMQHARSITC